LLINDIYRLWGSTRFHIQETLAEFAVELGVEIIFGAQVKNIDQSPPALVLNDGRKFDADLIIGADGQLPILEDQNES
jgi:2-polyprenyl-6-methoxyphenol hydroxylase-like FAD-dependent oxidoreductase